MKLKSVLTVAVAAWSVLAVAAYAADAKKPDPKKGPDETPPADVKVPGSMSRMSLGYTYFNRPGADIAAHNAEVTACAAEAAKTRSFDEEIQNGSSNGLLGAIIGDAMNAASRRGTAGSAFENCMVVRGWRVVHLSDAEGAELGALSQAELTEKLTPWVGAAEPHGDVVRTWSNEAASSATDRYSMRPPHFNKGPLSLIAVTGEGLGQFKLNYPPYVRAPKLDPKWPKKALKPADFGKAPPDAAIIIFRIKGVGFHNGIGVAFQRMGADPAVMPSTVDLGPDTIFAFQGILGAKKEGNFVAVAVPAGRWRLSNMGMAPSVNFCLGSPAFEAKAGEVIYAGAFDMSAADITPDMALDPVKAWLVGQPAAEKLTAAQFVNGSVGQCGNNAIYAIEFKGAPFEPSYHWGSQNGVAPAVAAGGN